MSRDLIVQGRVWKLGDDVSVHQILDGQHDAAAMAGRFSELTQHLLSGVRPDFSANAKPGDILVAGTSLGAGKHRWAAIRSLLAMQIAAVFSETMDPGFKREATELGMPAFESSDLVRRVEDGDHVHVDLLKGIGENKSSGSKLTLDPCPTVVADILLAGGYEAFTLARVAARRSEDPPRRAGRSA